MQEKESLENIECFTQLQGSGFPYVTSWKTETYLP